MDQDQSDRLIETVLRARSLGQPVAIAGTGSKSFLCRSPDSRDEGRLVSTLEHCGIVDYRPDELVVRVRSGTPLKTLQRELQREGQMLAFEPPEFQGLGSVGGAVASGLAGPGRPWRGGVRDSLLGVVMVNGLGERLTFGGQVMKNVAGFDVSRLQAGAFGIFGLLLDVSLRVLPLPHLEQTRVLEMNRSAALETMRQWALQPLPVSATAFHDGRLSVRLSGAEPAVLEGGRRLGGVLSADNDYWLGLKDHTDRFFREVQVGCRQPPPAAPLLDSDELLEWSGARRWARLTGAESAAELTPFTAGYARRICQEAGGDALLARYQRRLKAAFDPDNLFNPEICDADLAA